MRDPIKGKTEAGRRREQRALQTRARIAEAALRLFGERGYVATTVEAIAADAAVAPATVYQAFGTKQGVLARALDATITGDAQPVALLDREWVAAARRQRDARRRLAAVVRGAAQVAAQTAALKEVMRDAAATDPMVRDLIRDDHERRRETQRALVQIAVGDDALRPGMTCDRAADAFFLLVNSSTYQLTTEVLGWSDHDWQQWLVELLTREFFGGISTERR
ncbi:MAG: TetR/AcrR family transcriptional regulator [Dermatophilaceae bacterium]|nr:TetR/AcrR family transcriptional regulator [Intrasporangiaceae bacterium]